jgi:hypothetical protein
MFIREEKNVKLVKMTYIIIINFELSKICSFLN